jgi:hypothetical protein
MKFWRGTGTKTGEMREIEHAKRFAPVSLIDEIWVDSPLKPYKTLKFADFRINSQITEI